MKKQIKKKKNWKGKEASVDASLSNIKRWKMPAKGKIVWSSN
jgi:hypothetical protein